MYWKLQYRFRHPTLPEQNNWRDVIANYGSGTSAKNGARAHVSGKKDSYEYRVLDPSGNPARPSGFIYEWAENAMEIRVMSFRYFTLYQGHVLDVLKSLQSESVQCCVTSPPYWGLRDYGTATWQGGSPNCDHNQQRQAGENDKSATNKGASRDPFTGGDCRHCGASRIDSQLGLEKTPEAYVVALVDVFREVNRVLRNDGTLWLNLGDSYNSGTQCNKWEARSGYNEGLTSNGKFYAGHKSMVAGLKSKDLVGIPWMVAFALRADGWYLRSDIIWSKPNPMPESVTDRPTKSHEYIFLLSKSGKYFFDADAVREEGVGRLDRWPQSKGRLGSGGKQFIDGAEDLAENNGRNIRSVWNIATQPFSEAHFATFPKALVERCVKAGTKEGDTVLDPFTGSGTTGLVALRLGRNFIGAELNPEYVKMARDRIYLDAPLFNQELRSPANL